MLVVIPMYYKLTLFQNYGRSGATKVVVGMSDDSGVLSSRMSSHISTAQTDGKIADSLLSHPNSVGCDIVMWTFMYFLLLFNFLIFAAFCGSLEIEEIKIR